MKRAVGRGLCAAAFLGIALVAAFAAAPAAAQDSCTNCLQRPVVTSTPASGTTYYPGETIVVQVRPRSAPWVSITSADSPTLGLNVGGSVKSLSGNLQSQRFSYTYYDLGDVQTAYRDSNVLEFRYTVQKGDRDTDGVSVAANALGGGNIGANVGGSQHGGGTWRPNLSKNHSAMSAQSGHKVDTPAPSWSGVTAPDIIFYAGGSVSYRLPQVANAASAHNVSYSVTSARPLPTGYTLNASTATITGSYASALARQSYTLRATDGFSRTADLTFHLQVSADAGIESISITSNPGADKTYGKVAPFGTNDTITVRVDLTHRLTTVLPSNVCLDIQIGSNTRRTCSPSYSTSDSSRWDKLDFSYAVQAGDWDGDGISFPTNSMGAGKIGGLRFHRTGGGTDNRVNRNFASIPDDANHKVRGQQTVPSFGSTASPSHSWVKDNAVSQVLPAATGGDGGVTYSIEESLPAGLSFAAATRTVSGTPTAAQAAANYTLAATDADGDKATLRFSIEIQGITVSIDSPSVTEGDSGSKNLTFTATLSTASAQQVTVDYADAGTGTATSGADYTAITDGTLTFTAGTTSQTFDVSVTGDTTDEVDETILVTLSNASGATISTATGTGTITDNDDPPTVSVAAASVTEGDSGSKNLTFTATLSAASGKQVTVTWAEGTGGTATSGTDYTAITGGTLTFAAGTTSQTFNVSVTGDVVDESNETVVVTLSSPANATISATAGSATGTITDNDATPTSITLTVNDDSVDEGDGDTTITVTATVDGTTRFGTAKTVSVSVAGSGTASAVDFAAVSDFNITIAAGTASKSETFTLSPTDDSVDETDETITVSGTSSGLTINSDTITLSDDDDTPSITLSVSDSSVAEDDGATTITVTATVDGTTRFGVDKTVSVSVAGSGTAAAVDFAAVSNFNISIGAGETSGTETFTLTPTDDTVHEANETITVSGTSGTLTVNSATITLTDDEALPTVALALSPTSIGEAGGASTVTATLSAVSSAAVTLTVAAAAGTGAVAADFSLSTAKTLTIAAGATTSTGTVTVTAADNDVDAANKSVTISATVTGGNGVAAPSDVTLTLTDDDTAGVTFNPTTLTVTEQGASQSFTVVLDSEPTGGTNGTTWVGLTPSDTDELDLNSALTYPYNLSFTTSNWDTAQTVAVTALGDSDRTNDTKQIRYTVAGYTGGEVTNQLAVTVTVIDDDKPTVSLSLSSSSISENGGVATVTATLDEAATVATTVTVAAAAGADTDASDFTLSSANTLTIAAGNTTSTGTVTITGVNNALNEPDKSVTVSGTVSHDGVAPPTAKTLTITDDDPAPMLSINSPSVTEGNSGSKNLTFTATLSAASGRQVTVDYADAGIGTATSGTDYTAITAGTLTFAAGTTSQTFNVSVTGDVLDEADETVKVRMKDPVNAAVSTTAGTGTGTITDDDATPTLLISSPSVSEGDSGSTALTYTVTLSAASGREVTVQYADSGLGTATSGTDYTAITAGTLTFAAGTTSRTFSVSVTGDTVAESDETVEVTWSNAANAMISTRAGLVTNALRVDGTITDDDGAPDTITLTVDDDDVGEGEGATTITVTATVDGTTRFAEAKTVTVSVAGTGTAGAVDFTAVSSFNISIAAGAASGTGSFTLTPTDDSDDETDETITVSGTSTGLTVNPDTISLTDDDGTPTSITLTVNDDSVGEGDGATTITVTATLDGSTTLGSATTVRVHVAGSGTATAVDFDTVSAFDITIAAGDASGTANFTLTPTDDVEDETDERIKVRGTSSGLTVNSATISLTDDDAAPTSITLTVDDSSVGEGDGATSITVTATVDGTTRFAEAKTVRVSVAGTGAAGAVDFAAVEAFDIEIAAGAASDTAGFTLTPTDDAVDETDETITVSGTSGSLTVNSATISLTDDDGAPTSITLTVDDSSVGEGDGAATITVTATVDGTMRFAEDTTVTVSVAGSGAATAVDFAAVSSFNITIPAGAASRTGSFTLTPTDDAVDETDETVTVGGMSGSLTVNSATITLTDNDAAPTAITLTVSDDSVSEGDGATAITVTATVDGTTRFAADTTVSVLVRTDSGTMNAVDFASVPGFDITIAAGAASGTETFTLTPTNDAVDENDETITVYGASGSLTVSSATITLTDDDATPTAITLTVSDSSVAEDDGATTITVTATVDGATRFATATTVTVSVAGTGTASAVDFAAVSDFDVEIDAADASATETFTLTPTNDVLDETNETITVSGTSGSLTVNSATITLTDDDATPSITLTVNDDSVAEDDGATTITVTATVDGTTRFVDATTVTVSVAGSGTATAVDFAAVSDFNIEIAAEAQSKTGTFTLTPTNDVVDETNETITVSGSSGSLTVNAATITLTDDDATPSITLTVDDNSVAEDDGATTITVTATVDGTTRFAGATTVTVSVAGSGTATAVDFAAVSDFNIEIAAEAQSKTGTFTLTPTNDAVDETDETVTVSGESGSLTVNSATIALTDDDAAPTAITLTVSDSSVAEDDGATTITVTATVDGTTRFAAATTVSVSVSGSGTATAVDFAAVSSFNITISAEAASANNTFTLTPTDDAVDETDETVTVSGESGSLTVNSATIALTDDDAAPTAITLTVNDNSVAEDDGATTITVTATVDGTTRFAAATTVTVSVAGTGTATAVDFAAVSDFNIQIAAEAQSKTGTFTLTPTNDAEDEADETVTVSGESGSLTVNSATITLADDDPMPSLSIDSPIVAEGNAGAKDMTFTVTLSAASGRQVTVNYAVDSTDPGTATSGTDYAPVSSGTLTFAVGATSRTVTVSVTGDTAMEPDETVRLTLSAPTNATLGTATGVGTIVSEDGVSLIRIDADPTTVNVAEPGPLALKELSTDSANSKSYSVRLKTPPTQTATVTITSGDTGAVTVNDTDGDNTNGVQNTLTFTAQNWSAARTVTLTAAEDDDGADESVAVTHAASTASNSEYTGMTASLTATVDDDETPAVVIDADPSTANVDEAGPLTLTEGHASNAKTYSVRLATEPTQTVTVTLTSADTGAVSIDDTDGDNTNGVQNALTFTSTTWETAQSVTARAADDDDATDESVALGATASTATTSEYTGVTASLAAAVDDDETRAVTLGAATLSVPENGSAMYTAKLAAQPVGGNVTVTITGAGSGITARPTTLTFTPTSWSTAQTVTVSAAADLNGVHESVTLRHAASGADYNSVTPAEIVATATDDDGPSLHVSSNMLTVEEGSSAAYQVRLNTQPSAGVTVTVGGATTGVTVDTDGDATGNQTTLTFSTTDWGTDREVKVSAAADDDATNETLTLTHGASGATEYTGLAAGARPSVAVTVDDDDTRAVLIDADPTTTNVDDPGPLALNELSTDPANAKTYSVRLATEPTTTVTVTITSGDAGAASIDDTDGDNTNGVQNALTFTTTTWDAAQSVTVRAVEDDDGGNETLNLTHAANGGDYNGVSATLGAKVADDDPLGLVFAATDLTTNGLDEGGSATYAVKLATQPTIAVAVAISSDDADVTVDDTDGLTPGVQSSLAFDATTWNTAQTVTIRAGEDDDGADETVTLTHDPSGADYGSVSNATVQFTLNDDDPRGLTLSASTLSVPENDSATYTVKLDTQPVGGNATVTITGAAGGITASPTTLTFTRSNWSATRTVTVSAANDANTANEVATLTHTPTGADYGGVTPAALAATATDDDTPSLRVSPTVLTVAEGGSAAYKVRLNTQPSAGVTVTVGGATGAVTVDTDGDATGDQSTLTFSTTDWGTDREVRVSAAEDDDATNEMLALNHAANGGDYTGLGAGARPGVTVTVDDDDTPAILIDADPSTTNVDETGPLALNELSTDPANSKSYTVRLATEPTTAVTVEVESGDRAVSVDTDMTPRTRTLAFTTTNWSSPRTVTATAAEDDDASDERVTIAHSAAGGDYQGVEASLVATTVDDDDPALLVDASALTPAGLAEGASGTYTVRLATQPTGAVRVAVSVSGGVSVDADGDQAGDQGSLRFGAADWDVPKAVRVRALRDADAAAGTASLGHSASGSDYGGVSADAFSFEVRDGDAPALAVSASSLAVNEGSSAAYSVALATRPVGGSVTVSLSSSDAAAATVSPSSLTFTAGNWDRPRTVTVLGVADADSTDGSATVSHAASGADYDLVAATVSVAVRDSGAAGVRVEPPQLTVREGGSGSYRVRLNTQPTATTTVTATATSTALAIDDDGTPQSRALTFTTEDWGVGQAVTVSAGEDDGSEDGAFTVTHAVSGYAGVSSAPALAVAVEDDDAPGFAFAPAGGLPLSEPAPGVDPAASSGSYSVRLATQPTATTTVAVTSDDAGVEVDGAPRTLTFDGSNWDAPQTVTVRAVADADAVSETASLRHAASGGGYGGVSASLPVRVLDATAPPPDPEPPPVNQPPRAVGSLPDLNLDVGESASLALAGAFADDGPLTHRAESSDPSVASARVSGNAALRVEGLSAGLATVTVTATDRGGLSARLSFRASVGRVLSFAAPSASAPEGGVLRLGLTLSRPASAALSVAWAARPDGDPATADADAADLGAMSGTAAFAAGGTEAFIEIPVPDDADIEPAREFLAVELAAPPEGAGWALGLSEALLEVREGVCDRSPAVRDALVRDPLRGPRACWAPTPAELADRGYLSLDRKGVAALRPLDLLGLSGLRVLHLHGNRLSALPEGLFAGLGALERLRLEGNRLARLPTGTFAGLGRLSSLNLGGNRLTELAPDLLAETPGLKRLDLGGNRVESLPAGLFAGAAGLAELNLSGNPGAPFPLVVRLARTDAESWAPGPARVEARVAEGAPFPLSAGLLAQGAELSAAQTSVPAGATAGPPLQAAQAGPGAARLSLAADPAVPEDVCGDGQDGRYPCFRGLAPQAGPPLVLFKAPPRPTGQPPVPALSANGDRASLALDGLFDLAEADDRLTHEARSDRPDLLAARIADGRLVLEANEDGLEGTAVVTVTATDPDGLSASITLTLTVEFAPTATPNWRLEWMRTLSEASD